MSFGASQRSISPIVKAPARRFARVIPTMKSVYMGLGNYPRATMRQSGPSGGAVPSVDVIQTNPAFTPTPDGPQPG